MEHLSFRMDNFMNYRFNLPQCFLLRYSNGDMPMMLLKNREK